MALAFTPHTVVVTSAEQPVVGGRVLPKQNAGTGTSVPCMAWDESPSVAYDAFNVELRRPVRLLCDPEYKSVFREGRSATLEYNGETRTLEVIAAHSMTQGLPADHCDVLLKDSQYD